MGLPYERQIKDNIIMSAILFVRRVKRVDNRMREEIGMQFSLMGRIVRSRIMWAGTRC